MTHLMIFDLIEELWSKHCHAVFVYRQSFYFKTPLEQCSRRMMHASKNTHSIHVYPCMIHLPTCTIKINPNVGKYTSPMDGMGYILNSILFFSI